MPNWTKQQEQAIRARNHTILVSAAAGSGKTAVLVERIVSLVREGASMNRMLILQRAVSAAVRRTRGQADLRPLARSGCE